MAKIIWWKLLGLLLLTVGCFSAAWGQGAPTCASGRYVADVFADVIQTSGIVYGVNAVRDYSAGRDTPITLQLDFYEPVGDVAPSRPLIIFAFGGSFVTGQRADMDDLCRAFARKGYATATIDYRLVPAGNLGLNYATVFGNRALLADQLVRAGSDMKAAVRFFRRDAATANTYRIDPARIIVAGYSAGAVTALLTAYINQVEEDSNFTQAFKSNGGLEGDTDLPAPNTTLPAYNSANLAGVFSLAGAVARLSVVKATGPPLYAAHGTNDTTVPYASGPAFGVSTYTLYGGGALHARADSVGLTNQLYTIVGGDHSSSRQEPARAAITAEAAAFFQPIACGLPLPVTLVSFTARPNPAACTATLRWRSASELVSQAYEVQHSADGLHFTSMARVPSRNSPTGADYSFETDRLSEAAYFRLLLLDVDGRISYSPVVSLPGPCASAGLLLTPNPVQAALGVAGLPAGPCQLEVYAATGQRVAVATGAGPLTLDASAWSAGLYLIKATTAAGQPLGQARVVKQ